MSFDERSQQFILGRVCFCLYFCHLAERVHLIIRIAAEELPVYVVILPADLYHCLPNVIIEIVSSLRITQCKVLHVQLLSQ